MKLNRTGLIVCGVYGAFSLLLILMDYSSGEVKGPGDAYNRVVMDQIAILPYMLLVEALDFRKLVISTPWMNTIPTGFVVSLVLMYLVGCIPGTLMSGLMRMSEEPEEGDRTGRNGSTGRYHFVTMREIISEWWAASPRNRGRLPPEIHKPDANSD